MSANYIEVENVDLVYRTASDVMTALSDVSLTVGENEFLCIVGPSGCGKTSLLNLIAGFCSPTSGTIKGRKGIINGPGPDRTMMFQDYALFPWLSVQKNIEYGLIRKKIPKTERKERIAHYLNLIGLQGCQDKYPHQLSGGMRQRVALARALAVGPNVLLMDEPFAALDYFTREKMQDELIRVWESERKAVVFITHSIDEAVKLADRVIVMSPYPGRITEIVTIDAARPRALDSESNIKICQRIREALHLS